jgi:hypothetical protein
MGIDTEQKGKIMAGQNHEAEREGAFTKVFMNFVLHRG